MVYWWAVLSRLGGVAKHLNPQEIKRKSCLLQKSHAKRVAAGVKQPSKIGKDRAHLLTGVLEYPACGGAMHTNKHAWTNKDGLDHLDLKFAGKPLQCMI